MCSRLRFHTRFPIGIPERIDTSFLAHPCTTSRLQTYLSSTATTPTNSMRTSLPPSKKSNASASPSSLSCSSERGQRRHRHPKNLCEALCDHGILPYCLHQLDRVQGSAHYEVPEEKGRRSSSNSNPFFPATRSPNTSAKWPANPAKRPSSIRARAQPPEEDNTLTFSEITG